MPHVGGDEAEKSAFLGTEPVEKALERFDCSLLADPQESSAVAVDLIDEGDVGVPFPEGNLVGADRDNPCQVPVGEPPGHGHRDGLTNGVPRGLEDRCRLGPGEPLGPSGQKPRIGLRQRTLWILGKCPGKAFHANATPGAVDAPGSVDQGHGDAPDRKIGEAPSRLSSMARSRLSALAADRSAVGPGFHKDFNLRFLGICPLGLLEHEGLEFLNVIEDSIK